MIRFMPEIHCDRCGAWEQVPAAEVRGKALVRIVASVARRAGWRPGPKRGSWLCPACVRRAEIENPPDPETAGYV